MDINKIAKMISIVWNGAKVENVIIDNEFDGVTDCPIKSSLEIKFKNKYEENPNKFNYQMLSRLKSDCDYYLGNGNRYSKHLWAGNEQKQIDEMKKLYNMFPDNEKPEWLTYEQILAYEKAMVI